MNDRPGRPSLLLFLLLAVLGPSSLVYAQPGMSRVDGTLITVPECSGTEKPQYTTSTNSWSCVTDQTGGGGVPAGLITMIDAGTCPAGWAEVTALNGVMLLGTLAANANVGTTGGADTIVPAGTVAAPAFSGTAGTVPAQTVTWPAGVPTFSGSALGTHQHGVGTLANAWPVGVPTFTGTASTAIVNHVHVYTSQTATTGTVSSYEHGVIDTSSTAAEASISTNNPTGGVASYTPAGTVAWPAGVPTLSGASALVSAGTPAGVNAWPAGVPTNSTAAFTPAGVNSAPAFTGTSFDNRPAFLRVIFCKKS